MIQKRILRNGMTIIFNERKNQVVSVAFAVRFGGGNEKEADKGIAHFIEHMLYKGTPSRDAHRISEEIEKNGGELNGFTSEQITAFWCKMPSKHLNVALEVLSDMVKNPLFDKCEIDKERQVIFEEMKMYNDNPQMYVMKKIKSLMYKGDFSIPIIGTVKSMNNNDQKKIREMFERVYVPQNMILAVVGDANFSEICKFAENNFISKKGKVNSVKVIHQNKILIEKRKEIDQANLVFAYHIPLQKDRKFFAAYVLSVLMAGGMSSRLFAEIREKRNMAYAVKNFIEGEKDYSYAGIYIGTTSANVEKVKKLILEEFKKASKDIDEKELEQVKEQIIGNYLISQEDSHNVLLDMLISEIKGDAREVEKFIEDIRAVKLKDVKELAKLKSYSFFALVPE